ncbi:MAG: hypothetical protein RLZZ383_2003 [Pseudomonadota bacterium]
MQTPDAETSETSRTPRTSGDDDPDERGPCGADPLDHDADPRHRLRPATGALAVAAAASSLLAVPVQPSLWAFPAAQAWTQAGVVPASAWLGSVCLAAAAALGRRFPTTAQALGSLGLLATAFAAALPRYERPGWVFLIWTSLLMVGSLLWPMGDEVGPTAARRPTGPTSPRTPSDAAASVRAAAVSGLVVWVALQAGHLVPHWWTTPGAIALGAVGPLLATRSVAAACATRRERAAWGLGIGFSVAAGFEALYAPDFVLLRPLAPLIGALSAGAAVTPRETLRRREVSLWDALLAHPPRLLVTTFALQCLLGGLLLSLPIATRRPQPIPLIDAMFTSVSATCVTGLSVLDVGADLSGFGQVILLTLIQVGGLGVMSFYAFALTLSRQALSLQATRSTADLAGARQEVSLERELRRVFLITGGIEAVGAGSLFAAFLGAGMPVGEAAWTAVFTSISAFCNAGFTIAGANLVPWQHHPWILHSVGLLIIFGGLGPSVLSSTWYRLRWSLPAALVHLPSAGPRRVHEAGWAVVRRIPGLSTWIYERAMPGLERQMLQARLAAWRADHDERVAGGLIRSEATTAPVPLLSLHAKLVWATTAVLLIVPAGLIWRLEARNALASLSGADAIHNAWFQSVTLRTAGFNSIDLSHLEGGTLLVMLLAMFVGGSPGSTAGGAKTTTLAVLVLAIRAVVRGREDVEAFGRRLDHGTVYRAGAVAVLGLSLVLGALFALLVTQAMPFHVAAFEVVSAIGTVGLTVGGTPLLNEVGKLIIMGCMFAGRVGPLTLVLLLGATARTTSTRYPLGQVPVG